MNSISYSQRYLPHTIETRFYAVKLYRGGNPVKFVCRRYHISKASLMRWNKKFDGTKESLADKSHRPLTPHPNAHTEVELKWIHDLHRRKQYVSDSTITELLDTGAFYTLMKLPVPSTRDIFRIGRDFR